MSLRDIFGKLIKGFRAPASVDAPPPTMEEVRKAEGKKVLRDLSRYIYLSPGYNRHERRAMESRLNKLYRKWSGTNVTLTQAESAELEVLKWQLKNSPKNRPANVKRVIRGEGRSLRLVKVWPVNNPFFVESGATA